MARLLFVLPAVGAGDQVRVDTASGSDTPADITPAGSGAVIAGARLHADNDGNLPRILGPADGTTTLYVKTLDYRGNVTGSPVTVTGASAGSANPSPVAVDSSGNISGVTGGPVDLATQAELNAVAASRAPLTENVNTVAASGTAVTLPDVSTATMHRVTLTANCTVTLPAPAAGKSLTVEIVQDGTGGRTLAFATPSGAILWPAGTAPTPTTGASKRDVYTFACVGTNWLGSALLDVR